MTLARVTAWTLFALGGFALLAPTAVAQDPPFPKKPDTAFIRELRDKPRGGIEKTDLKRARESFKAFAKFVADTVAHPGVWRAPQELKVIDPRLEPPPTLEDTERTTGLLTEINRMLIEPGVTRTTNLEPADYIREFGAAYDAALKELIETHPERIVRVNAARVLAYVARTGAPAHFATVTGLLANVNTPTEVKYYLLQAAGALLGAPDVNEMRVRRHGADAATVGALVKALQDCVTNPTMLVPGVSLAKPETLTEDQLAVVGFVRRQAIRALGQTKFVTVPGPDGKTPLYPAHTLVRVALADPNLVPTPGPAEAAEAAIGLCNMAPVAEQLKGGFRPVKEYNSDVAVEAVTTALLTFSKPRANPFDRSLPWRTYAARLAEGLRNWRPLFDPDFEPAQPNKYNPALVPPGVEGLVRDVIPMVLAPMDKVTFDGKPDTTATVDVPKLQKRLSEMQARPKRNTQLFAGVAETSIEFPPPAPPKKEAVPPPPPPKKDGTPPPK